MCICIFAVYPICAAYVGAGPDLCAVCAAYFIVMCKVMCGFYFKMQLCAVGMCDISKLCARLCAT